MHPGRLYRSCFEAWRLELEVGSLLAVFRAWSRAQRAGFDLEFRALVGGFRGYRRALGVGLDYTANCAAIHRTAMFLYGYNGSSCSE